MNKLVRQQNKKKKNKKLKEISMCGYPAPGTTKLPGKLDNLYDEKFAKAKTSSDFRALHEEFRKDLKENGYFVPNNSSNYKTFYKKISRKTLRAKTREELKKDPEEIYNKIGSVEDKEFEYAYNID